MPLLGDAAAAVLDALPFAAVGAAVALFGGRRLTGPALVPLVAAGVGLALLAGLAGISLERARSRERRFVLVRTTLDLLLFH